MSKHALVLKILQNTQDAQLSQRDRAAGCVIVFAISSNWNWETIFYGHYRSIFNHCDIIGLKICRIP